MSRRRQRPSDPFAAQYNGLCHGCWCEIEAGDEIVMWNGHAHHNDENCCDGLAEEDEEEVTDRLKDRWA